MDKGLIAEWDLANLPKETLIDIVNMLYRNYTAIDGRWFQAVEDQWGTNVAIMLDEQIWEQHSITEARRIKKALHLTEKGLPAVFKALNFTLWRFFNFAPIEYEEINPKKVIISFKGCPIQEARLQKGKGEFPCKSVGLLMLQNAAQVIDPGVSVKCLFCPPDPHPTDIWCKWEFTE